MSVFHKLITVLIYSALLFSPACAIFSNGQWALEIKEEQILIDDLSLYVRKVGAENARKVLIAVNGGPGISSHTMLSLDALASNELTVVSYDQRGVGRSSKPGGDSLRNFDLEDYVADLEAVRQSLGFEKIILFGHGWGGLIVIRYASLYPKQVDRLILMGSYPPTWEATQEGFSELDNRVGLLITTGVIPLEVYPDLCDYERAILPAYFSDPEFDPPGDFAALECSTDSNRMTWSALGNFDFTLEFSEIEHPTLFLWGRHDPYGIHTAEASVEALSNTDIEVVILEDCGHYWHECPEPFFSALDEFIK